MNVLTVPRTLATYEYAMLRIPLTLVGNQVVARYLEEDSPVRLGFERTLGSLDATAGRLLGDPSLAQRGEALKRHADVLATAARLEEKAAERTQQADAELTQARQQAERQRREASQQAQAEAAQAVEKQRAQRAAAEKKAEQRTRAAATAADREKAAKVRAEQQQLDASVTAIDSRTKARTAAPKAELSDAVEQSQQAAAEQRTADRLGQLADSQKAARTQP
ncbi:MAG TPA: hypothetical protein VGD03_13880 [Frankiaceae bacterium]